MQRCGRCTSACPSFWWNPDKYVAPAGLLQAYRFLVDSRDTAAAERLDNLVDPFRLGWIAPSDSLPMVVYRAVR
jgi:succinate dehydrogenase / fumarate reductase iron-sulfur subunit